MPLSILDNLNTYLSKCEPKYAKFAQRCNRLCQILGELPAANLTGVKFFELSCVEDAKLNKRSQLSDMEDMLISLHLLPGCTVITRSYNALMDSVDLDLWGQHFQSYVAEFENSLGDFREQNLTKLFQKVFKGKCESSWDPLFQTFNHLWTCRSMYFYIKCKYVHHLPSTVVVDLEKLIQNEMALYERDASILETAAETVTGGFFMAGLTCDRTWNLQLGYIPLFTAVDKSEENLLVEKTVGELLYRDKNRNSAPAKLYKIPGEQHVYVHNTKDDHEYIFKLREDGLLQDGLHKYRDDDGFTEIGCRLFWREDRIEHRRNILCRYSSSGEIRYEEFVWGKEDNWRWRCVTSFRYHPDTFSWNKLEIE